MNRSDASRHDAITTDTPRSVELHTKVLARNDEAAQLNRRKFDARGVLALNIMSSPGSGKTSLLESTLDGLMGRVRCAVIAGDQATDNDARRLRGRGARVCQIETQSSCHLNAEQVGLRTDEVLQDAPRLLFIENVGNLVCPAAFDLGEHVKVSLLSVTEGEDKPVKYPALFFAAPLAVLTKMDLVQALGCDVQKYRAGILAVRPDARIVCVSARTGEGMGEWLELLVALAAGGLRLDVPA